MGKATDSLMTADRLLELPAGGLRHELIRGELTSMPPNGSEHGRATYRVAAVVGLFVDKHELGECFGAEGGFLIERDPDTVLSPDFAFVGKSRLGKGGSKGFFPVAPDLAVEVLSPNDRAVEIEDKTQRWLDAGCRQVWIINLQRRTIAIHRKDKQPEVLKDSDMLDAGDLLPGFKVSAAELFPRQL